MKDSRRTILIGVVLVIAILAVFGQTITHEFVSFDDYSYVVENHYVRAGLTREGFIWAFKSGFHRHWHPLTWLSHMADCELFGLKPWGHHLVSLLFHTANTLLLFLIFLKMTRACYASAFMAALFAVHPFHVETVAWVADRKDLLVTFFWFLTIWTYVRYCEKPDTARFTLVFLFMALGVLCKSSIMTLPFTLLLLDYWPLSRLSWGQMEPENRQPIPKSSLSNIIVEKIPLFLLAAGAIIAAYMTKDALSEGFEERGSLLPSLSTAPRALLSLTFYVVKTIWPYHLATPYPKTQFTPFAEWKVAAAIIILFAISAITLWQVRKRPYLIVGWLFFLGNILPVIRFFKIGPVTMADRYTYVPLIGLFVMVVFYFKEQIEGQRFSKNLVSALSTAVVLALMTGAFLQTRHWKNSVSLFMHAIQVTQKNELAHNNLGIEYMRIENTQRAMEHFKKALAIRPNYPSALVNIGALFQQNNRLDVAKTFYFQALKTWPEYAQAHYNLGWALEQEENFGQAEYHYRKAIKALPDYSHAHNNLGVLMARKGRFDEAVKYFQRALKIRPQDAQALTNLGGALQKTGKTKEAKRFYQKALKFDRDNTNALFNLAGILELEDDLKQAESLYRRILISNPESAKAYLGLGRVAESRGELQKALSYYQEAINLKPNFSPADISRKRLLEKLGLSTRESS